MLLPLANKDWHPPGNTYRSSTLKNKPQSTPLQFIKSIIATETQSFLIYEHSIDSKLDYVLLYRDTKIDIYEPC